jgi:hypothetical protein
MEKNKKNVFYTKKENNIDGSTIHQWIEKELTNQQKYKNIQNLDNIIRIPNRYIPLSQTIFRFIYPDKDIYVMRTIKQTSNVTDEMKERIEKIDDDFTRTVRDKKKIEIEKVDPNIIKMNRLIQRRYIMERLEKKNEERKDGDFVEYKMESSDLNNPLNEGQNTIGIRGSESNELKNVESQNKNEPVKGNRYLNM